MPETSLPRTEPERLGIKPQAIEAFIRTIGEAGLNLHSFMLVRKGQVAAEYWRAPHSRDDRYHLFSLSKSFTSTAIGMAAAEGLLSVNDSVLGHFPEHRSPEVERNMGRMIIRHLLTMSTGHAEDPTRAVRDTSDGDWVRAFFRMPIEEKPGERFVYNSAATYMLSAIIQRVSGRTLLDFLEPRLFEPLGITGASWETCPAGVQTGGWGLSLGTEAIAKFGQLYVQGGVWNGERLLAQSWIEEATASHISTASMDGIDKQQGYGYQFWRCRFGAYCGRGANGQFCIVLPEQNAVIAITSDEKRMQSILDHVWTHLLPAFD